MTSTSATTDLVPELESVLQELEDCDAQAHEICTGLTTAQLVWRPAPKSWSIAENLIHLRITTATFAPAAESAIRDARNRRFLSRGPFSRTRMDRFFIWYVEPPPRIRLPAPKLLRPPLEVSSGQKALEDFLQSQQLMRRQIMAADGIDLNRARVASPIASYIRMSLLAFLFVHTAHERRHLWQASRARQLLFLQEPG